MQRNYQRIIILLLQVGSFAYSTAKERMLEFYYDFVNTYSERLLFHYLETDTDSTYMSLAGSDVDSLARRGGGYCHTKTVGVCHQSPMEHMERERERNQVI